MLSAKIRVIVVDDHALFRAGLQMAFRYEYKDIMLVGEAGSGRELFDLPAMTEADLILLDVNLPDMSGVDIARRLRAAYPSLKILAVSAENTVETVLALIEVGIDGFVTKQSSGFDELARAIRSVTNGIEYFGHDVSTLIRELYLTKKKTTTVTGEFTPRESEIIALSHEGLLYKEIADRLGISVHAVNFHKKNIYAKLGVNNTVEMVRYALKQGIIKI